MGCMQRLPHNPSINPEGKGSNTSYKGRAPEIAGVGSPAALCSWRALRPPGTAGMFCMKTVDIQCLSDHMWCVPQSLGTWRTIQIVCFMCWHGGDSSYHGLNTGHKLPEDSRSGSDQVGPLPPPVQTKKELHHAQADCHPELSLHFLVQTTVYCLCLVHNPDTHWRSSHSTKPQRHS